MKWGRTHEIQTFLWCIFQFAWPFDRVNSATSVTMRQLCVYPPAPSPPTSVTCRAEKQAAAAACWEPKMSYKQHNTWPSETDNLLNCHSSKWVNPQRLNKTCQAKQAGVTNKQTLFRSCKMGTTDKFFNKKLSDHAEISTHSHTVHACTRARTHSLYNVHSQLTHAAVTSKGTRR